MKYASIDIETSGLDSTKHQILSIGAIIEDTKLKLPFDQLPKFNTIVLQRDITGSPFALNLNKDIIELMGRYLEGDKESAILDSDYVFLEKDEVVISFFRFLFRNGIGYPLFDRYPINYETIESVKYPTINTARPITINVAGKNFGTFDKLFLEKLPRWKQLIRMKQRIIDPSPYYCDWDNDEALPSLQQCKDRAGVTGTVSHTALDDAWDVIQVLRKQY